MNIQNINQAVQSGTAQIQSAAAVGPDGQAQ